MEGSTVLRGPSSPSGEQYADLLVPGLYGVALHTWFGSIEAFEIR